MSNQKQVDVDLIKKICGQEMSFRFQGALNNLESSTVKIVNTGMVSSGKSSLYNLITDNATTERFPTGAARTTTNADSYKYKNMEYIDTPGIDVRDIDDEIAYKTVMESDIILMVHNIKTGPLTRSESDWLTRIACGMKNTEMCEQRMIFICTWKDAREHEQGYNEIVEEIKQMVFDAVGTNIPFFDVSIKKYLDGVNKNKEILCEKSGIPDLKEFVENFAQKYAAKKEKYAFNTFEEIANEVRNALENSRNDNQKLYEKKRTDTRQRFALQRNSWKDVFGYFKSRRETLDDLRKELENI